MLLRTFIQLAPSPYLPSKSKLSNALPHTIMHVFYIGIVPFAKACCCRRDTQTKKCLEKGVAPLAFAWGGCADFVVAISVHLRQD